MTLDRFTLSIRRAWGKSPKRTAGSWLVPLLWALSRSAKGGVCMRVDSPALYLTSVYTHQTAVLGPPPRPGAVHLGGMDLRNRMDLGKGMDLWTLEVSLGPSQQGILGCRYLDHGLGGRVWAPRGHDPWPHGLPMWKVRLDKTQAGVPSRSGTDAKDMGCGERAVAGLMCSRNGSGVGATKPGGWGALQPPIFLS